MIRLLRSLLSERNPLRLVWHHAKALVAAVRYGFPARHLCIIGITGTDGKTTTVGMTAHILHKSGISVGALSTAFFQWNEEVIWNKTQKTSPSPFIIQKFLRTCIQKGCTHVVLEISSHGLVQGRTRFTWPQVAAITNTSMEHLDYHKTMEQYRKDKGKLFAMVQGKGTKILNRDDESYQLYKAIASKQTLTFSPSKPAEDDSNALWISDEVLKSTSCDAILHYGKEQTPLHLPISGHFNVLNALCAIGCCLAVDVPLSQSKEALQSFTGVPGRMERIDEGQSFSVFIDFTVTPKSYEQTLTTLRSMIQPGKRILVLTGSCGDRMKEKRPLVGKICSTLADVVVVTNEDPYTEDPQKIIDDVWRGVDASKTQASQIFDRKNAMEFILKEAKEGDAVLLAGKGSDTTMWVQEGQIPWNEREICREVLRSLKVNYPHPDPA